MGVGLEEEEMVSSGDRNSAHTHILPNKQNTNTSVLLGTQHGTKTDSMRR